ncbi:hypothetical protein LCGC14_0378170 [marine sediment metagenome]|uniref:Uncharacterized protein n=1 Tax=marine sediment metagenome TaxID=412755 RepID=A0A0F9T949_9ZZZZ
MPHISEPLSDEQWAAQRDAETLAEARAIMQDVSRLNAAKTAAENLAVEKLNSVKDLLAAAGVSFSNVVKGLGIKESPTQFNPNSQRDL